MRKITNKTQLKNGKTFPELLAVYMDKPASTAKESFKDIFGDLSDATYIGDLDLREFGVTSLEGCTKEVSGNFLIFDYGALKSLKGFPKIAHGSHIQLNNQASFLFKDIDSELYKNASTLYCDCYDLTPVDIVLNFSNWRKVKGSFKDLQRFRYRITPVDAEESSDFDYEELERLWRLYKNLNFNSTKLKRATTLIYL